MDDLIEALRRPPSTRAAAIDALAGVSRLRAAVDDVERTAVDTARAGGATWAEIAAALGLSSRQAAEQRRARLGGGPAAPKGLKRQQDIDNFRQALHNLAVLLDKAPAADLTGTGALARQTLRIALEAPPGQQIDLARLAVDDLRAYAGHRPTIAAAVRRVALLAGRTTR